MEGRFYENFLAVRIPESAEHIEIMKLLKKRKVVF